jgi:putative heme iron utilization protein
MAKPHAGRETTQTSIPELSLAERARTLVYLGTIGSLSTVSAKHPGWPFGSVMPYGLDRRGRPTFLISSMAMHTQNLLRDPRASLLVTQAEVHHDPLAIARITLMGTVTRVPQNDLAPIRDNYLKRYPEADQWADFGDFAWFRMEMKESYLVGGFGIMGWIDAADYDQAEVDPLADIAASVLEHMNHDHADALVLLARHVGQCPADSATMTAVDHLGFHLRIEHQGTRQDLRLPFPQAVRSASKVRQVLAQMVQQARPAEMAVNTYPPGLQQRQPHQSDNPIEAGI